MCRVRMIKVGTQLETALFGQEQTEYAQQLRPAGRRIEATREEVEAAAAAAQLGPAIARMAEGYATVVGERGRKLSGG